MISQHFQRAEFKCRGDDCDFDTVDVELLEVLEEIRTTFNVPIKILSGCRCPAHNRAVGGSPKSQHLLGKAADIVVCGYQPEKIYQFFEHRWPQKYGLGLYKDKGFVHIDIRAHKARWDNQKPGAES